MKIKVLADRAVVVSDVKFASIEKLVKYDPEVLVHKDEDGNETFRVGVDKSKDAVGKYGVTFIADGDEAIARVDIPVGTEDKAEWVADNYGIIVAKLKDIEEAMVEALDDVDTTIAEIKGSIEMMDYAAPAPAEAEDTAEVQ